MEKSRRIEIIDALRGLSVVLMVAHHALYDVAYVIGAPEWLYWNPVFAVLHYIFAGVFVFLAGVSSRFSRSNLKRGLLTALMAAIVSAATFIVGDPVLFGVLHLLAVCMLLYSAFGRYLERVPERLAPVLYVILLIAGALVLRAQNPVGVGYLFPLGLYPEKFYSADFFPLVPWVFVFLLGTWAGRYIRDRRLPAWFYAFDMPVLPEIGRRSLWIYMLHQPILYGIALIIAKTL
jgi:uncharacterized membrane protein